ncbi:hypothetical protein [Geopsychrobacter electrodiphilus]|uniref:hypothetical protein n=1 Tax=Geopsychrobacter electrodiphilus TaxID=225196 RepID=UPI00035D4E2A|nr:hypothetical protein [Geopsychrobacter electrodiphilus]
MKCPKCGYNSFDHLDSCKKCGKDLAEHKARFNIRSVLLAEMPMELTSTVAEEILEVATATAGNVGLDDFADEGSGEDVDDFGFDFMGDSEDDENLAFDELFEEVASEDDVEETLPAPEASEEKVSVAADPVETPVAEDNDALSEDDFSFDEPDAAPAVKNTTKSSAVSPAEFGFDADEDPAADIFAESEEDFSLDSLDFDEKDK